MKKVQEHVQSEKDEHATQDYSSNDSNDFHKCKRTVSNDRYQNLPRSRDRGAHDFSAPRALTTTPSSRTTSNVSDTDKCQNPAEMCFLKWHGINFWQMLSPPVSPQGRNHRVAVFEGSRAALAGLYRCGQTADAPGQTVIRARSESRVHR